MVRVIHRVGPPSLHGAADRLGADLLRPDAPTGAADDLLADIHHLSRTLRAPCIVHRISRAEHDRSQAPWSNLLDQLPEGHRARLDRPPVHWPVVEGGGMRESTTANRFKDEMA